MDQMPHATCVEFKQSCGIPTCQSMLDVVYLWVNGSDPALKADMHQSLANALQQKDHHIHFHSFSTNRFRELGQFKYSLRSLELHLPFTRRIFIVTNRQVPSWLDTSHPQIRIVDHSQLQPYGSRKDPVKLFNSMAIQSMIHSIPTLSSPFLYAEDDTYFGRPIPLEKLWENGRVNFELSSIVTKKEKKDEYNYYEKSIVQSLDLVESLGMDTSYFYRPDNTVIFNAHIPMMLYPESIDAIWTAFPREMLAMSSRPFRSSLDPHFWSLYVFMDGKQEKHNFDADSDSRFYLLTDNGYQDVLSAMVPYSFMCINDDLTQPTNTTLENIVAGYETLFPRLSAFER
ncbi:hypothetical protein HDV03_000638 [Kappamyces sp. JEL0829]|nr:hypothetical protein HDV03_000638 [Kappamyces sp. JEL0829]